MIVAGTRLHSANGSVQQDIDRLADWIRASLGYCDTVLVATDPGHYTRTRHLREEFGERLWLLYVDPWVSFTQPLNMMLEKALSLRAELLLFQSVEVRITDRQFHHLLRHMDDETLVVGGRMIEQHAARCGVLKLSGWCVPWNTLALWNAQKLANTGFLPVSGGNVGNIPGGVEEALAISLLQALLPPGQARAKIADLGPVEWEVTFKCMQRMETHREKMLTKASRAEAQLSHLEIGPGEVEVIHDWPAA